MKFNVINLQVEYSPETTQCFSSPLLASTLDKQPQPDLVHKHQNITVNVWLTEGTTLQDAQRIANNAGIMAAFNQQRMK
jgi:hypothetical protein